MAKTIEFIRQAISKLRPSNGKSKIEVRVDGKEKGITISREEGPHGHAIRSGSGKGDAIRRGSGDGTARRDA